MLASGLELFSQKQASNYRHAREWVKDQEAVLAPRLFSNGCGKLESVLAAKGWNVSLPHYAAIYSLRLDFLIITFQILNMRSALWK